MLKTQQLLPKNMKKNKIEGPVVKYEKRHIGTFVNPHTQKENYILFYGRPKLFESKGQIQTWCAQRTNQYLTLIKSLREQTSGLWNNLLLENDNQTDLQKATPQEINNYFKNLYSDHLQNGMAPKYFKSARHLARIVEIQKNLPFGYLTRHITEAKNEELPTKELSKNGENAKVKISQNGPETQMVIKKTLTGKVGPIIDINPQMNAGPSANKQQTFNNNISPKKPWV